MRFAAVGLLLFAYAACGAPANDARPTSVPVGNVTAKPLPSAPAIAPCSASEDGVLEPSEAYGRPVRVLIVCGVPDERTRSAISAYLNFPPGRQLTEENLATGLVRRMDVVARATSSGAVDLEIHCEPTRASRRSRRRHRARERA